MSQAWERLLEEELTKPGGLAILGVGNTRKGDDAAGVFCATLIRNNIKAVRPDIMIVEGGVTPESETGRIRQFGPSRVLIIDAALGGHAPGTIFVVKHSDILQDDLSTHHMPLSLLIRYFEASLDCRVICLGIEPGLVEAKAPLSSEVKLAVASLAERVVGILERKPLV